MEMVHIRPTKDEGNEIGSVPAPFGVRGGLESGIDALLNGDGIVPCERSTNATTGSPSFRQSRQVAK